MLTTDSLMKKMLIALLLLFLAFVTSCYDVHKAPKKVQNAFDSMFPESTRVEWERELSVYKAEFIHDGHEKDAWFSPDGVWMNTRTKILLTEVPDAVLSAAHEYSDWDIDDVVYCERAEGIKAYYLIEYDKEYSEQEKTVRILPDGTIMMDM